MTAIGAGKRASARLTSILSAKFQPGNSLAMATAFYTQVNACAMLISCAHARYFVYDRASTSLEQILETPLKRVRLVYTIKMALSRLRTAEPSARHSHAAVGCGGNLFVWGGYGGSSSPVPSSVLERFNVVSTSWLEPRQLRDQSLPDGLHRMAVTSDGEKAYFFGGMDESGERNNSLYCLDLSSLVCRKIVPSSESPSPRDDSAMVHYRRKLVLYGGDTGRSTPDELFVFDLDTSEAYFIMKYCNTSILVRVHF